MRILIVRPGAIGDSLLTFPILRALHGMDGESRASARHRPYNEDETYKNGDGLIVGAMPCARPALAPISSLTFVSNSAVIPLALSWQLADEVHDYQELQWSELFSTIGVRSPALRSLLSSTDLAICWLRDPDGIVERNLHAANIGRVVVTPGRPTNDVTMHIVEYLAKTANIQLEEQAAYGWPKFSSTRIAHGPIAIHPGSGGARKCWPITSFAQVIQSLWQRAIPVLLLAGPADSERIDTLIQLLSPVPPLLLTTMFDAPLTELASALQHCRGYLGNDAGITHLAALIGIPTLALFGPSDPRVWHPVGADVHVIYEKVLADISIDRVLRAIEQYTV